MSAIALVGGVVLYLAAAAATCARGTGRSAAAAPGRRAAHLRAHPGRPVVALGARAGSAARHAPPAAAVARCWWCVAIVVAAAAVCCGAASAPAARALTPLDPALLLVWAGRRGLRGRRRLAGQVPPAGGADPDGRRRSGHLPHLRLVLGARPGADPAAGRDRHHGADAARPALAAAARRAASRDGDRAAGARCAALRDLAVAVLAGGGLAAAGLCGDDAAAAGRHLALLHRARLHARAAAPTSST